MPSLLRVPFTDKLDFAIIGVYDVLILSVKVHSEHKFRNVKPDMDDKL